jgi:peptidoglycan/LPS O-acetylase OafA/YrhL
MKITYRPEIDGLRAIAVGAIILYHAQISILGYQLFKGGFVGVDIFFVISGYLITSIILKELVTTNFFSFKHFYGRRIRRILPALIFVILVSLPFAFLYLTPSSFIDFLKSILYSLGFSSNFYFHYSGQEYGAESGLLKPLLHTWSLSVEEQYYILFPIFLIIIFKYFRKYLINILISGFFISLCLAEWTSRKYPSASFYFLHTRMWELLAGSILAYFEITKGHRSKKKSLNIILPSIGLFLIGHSILFFDDKMLHPSFYTLSPIIGTCLILWFSEKDEQITKILSTKLFVGIGLISYSLYLWHYPIFAFARIIYDEGNIQIFFFIIIITFISSIISYYIIEKTFRNKKYSSKIVISILFLISVFLIAFIINILNFKLHPFLTEYAKEQSQFKRNYDYNNFNEEKKNVFIIGNSYADNLLNLFSRNSELNRKYYFYTALGDNRDDIYQIKCLKKFLSNKNDTICDNNKFSFFVTQFNKSDFIILAEGFDELSYKENYFIEITKILNKERGKKFIIILDDVSGADILDMYIFKKGKLPNDDDLNTLETNFFANTMNFEKNIIAELKKQFSVNDTKYITRSELFCDYSIKKCPLIRNNSKLYSDFGHITNNGAIHFSNKANLIIEKLLNN